MARRLVNAASAERIDAVLPAESSTLMSACHLHAAIVPPHLSAPTILEQVNADSHGHVDAEASAKLFSRLWRLAGRYRGLDIELEMSSVRSVASRFLRELAFLHRHLGHRGRRVLLTNVQREFSHLLDSSTHSDQPMEE